MSKTVVNRSFITVSGTTLLTALFVALKAFGKIDWSWWWVFAPLWGPWAILLAVGLAVLLGVGLFALVVAIADR